MAKQENRLKQLLTTNLESKLEKGLPHFKRRVEKEIVKHDKHYYDYRKDREYHRLQALQEMEELRVKKKDMLESQLEEVIDLYHERKRKLKGKKTELTHEELKECRGIQDKKCTLATRLDKFLDEDMSEYGVEHLFDPDQRDSDTDTESDSTVKEVDQGEKTIREIIAEHLALGEIPSNFEYSHKYRYPYDPELNTSGKWDLWKQPWFIETFPKHLLEVLKETSREILKKSAREVFEEGTEDEKVSEETKSHEGVST